MRSQTLQRSTLFLFTMAAFFAQATRAAGPPNTYLVHNLVADQPGIADFTDPNLVNPWGLYTSGTSPFWVNDAGTGLATVYTSNGSIAAVKPSIPPSAKGSSPALVTGGIFNGTGGFLVQGKSPNFIFVTADGTISAYVSSISTAQAQLALDNSSNGAVYYGLAVNSTTTSSAPQLYVANFASGKIEVYDTNYKPVTPTGNFTDSAVPSGYGPFNIWNLGGKLYVMWAQQNSNKTFATTGAGLGAVSIFDLNGNLLQHLATGGKLNAPWGVAIAPASFGAFANDVLVGNFGDGTINAFDPATGNSLGQLMDQNGNLIVLSGLWGLLLGNGGSGGDPNAIYFAAGTGNQKHGLLGSIQAPPTLTGVVNAADTQSAIAPNTYISIYGADLSPVTRNWTNSDFSGTSLPTSLGGISVSVDGKAAFVYYISPKQIDVLTPIDSAAGPVPVQVTNNGMPSNSMQTTEQTVSPAFFLLKDGTSIAAIHSNGSIVGATSLYTGESSPAIPGETIALYGTGFGTSSPSVTTIGVVTAPVSGSTSAVTVSFGGTSAQVTYFGLVGAGIYQINVVVPSGVAAGNAAVTAAVGGVSTASNAIVTVGSAGQ